MADITIVYKTYENDLQWLRYSLLSIKKFVTNYNAILIYCHDKAIDSLTRLLIDIKMDVTVLPVTYDFHGYIKQMVVKCMCYKDVTTKYVVILDSDTVFTKNYDMGDLIRADGKIEWIYSMKTVNSTGPEWVVWKKAYEDMTNTPQNIHFMSNGFPFIFTRESLEKAEQAFKSRHRMDYNEFCLKRLKSKNIKISDKITDNFPILATIFEEFEWLGYYCKNNSSDYVFLDNTNNSRNIWSVLKQHWSHGGITKEIKNELETTLGI